MVTLTLPMQATGKARPRATVRVCAKKSRGRRVKCRADTYNPPAYEKWKAAAVAILCPAIESSGWGRAHPRTPVLVRVVSYAKRPKERPGALAGVCTRKEWREGFKALRLATPDADNLEGAVWDALNDTGLVWEDDSQAVSVGCWEWYAAPGEGSRIEITLALGHVTRAPLEGL